MTRISGFGVAVLGNFISAVIVIKRSGWIVLWNIARSAIREVHSVETTGPVGGSESCAVDSRNRETNRLVFSEPSGVVRRRRAGDLA